MLQNKVQNAPSHSYYIQYPTYFIQLPQNTPKYPKHPKIPQNILKYPKLPQTTPNYLKISTVKFSQQSQTLWNIQHPESSRILSNTLTVNTGESSPRNPKCPQTPQNTDEVLHHWFAAVDGKPRSIE